MLAVGLDPKAVIMKRGQGNGSFIEDTMMYNYILNRDLQKLKARTDSNFAKRSQDYKVKRMKVSTYAQMMERFKVQPIGVDGKISDVAEMSKNTSWQATSVPDGRNAVLREQRFKALKPPGVDPNELDEIRMKRKEREQ